MKLKYLIILFLIINLIFCIYIINVKAISNNEYKIEEKNNNYKIIAYYPKTDYSKLNNVINDKIYEYIKEFKENVNSSDYPINQYYSLIILYDCYEYDNYISYIFRIEDYTGGAHPNHRIYTVVYDIKNNVIITIDDLINKNQNILNIFSENSREILKSNDKITSSTMLYEGTKPKKENFTNFVFSKNGIILFFQEYQVAPYSQGEFNVVLDYKKIR